MLGSAMLCRNTHYTFRHARFCNTELISGALLGRERRKERLRWGARAARHFITRNILRFVCYSFPQGFLFPPNISLPFARSHCIGGVEASRTGLSVGKDSIMWPETLPDALSNAGFPSIWSVGVLPDTFWSCKNFHSHISIYLLFPCFHVNWSLLADHFIQGYVPVFLNGIERREKKRSSAYLVCSLVCVWSGTRYLKRLCCQ